MTSSTSLIISGSSAEVGSSNSMIFGACTGCGRSRPAAAGRRTAGWIGVDLVGQPDLGQELAPGLLRLGPRGPAHMDRRQRDVLSAVLCGYRLNCWNTKPISVRSRGMSVQGRPALAVHHQVAALDRLQTR